jgi:uncharacterized membrane protein
VRKALFENVDEVPQRLSEEVVENYNRLFRLLILGFVLIFAGVIVIVVATLHSGNGVSGFGGVIFIGPFPIAFGAGPDAAWLIAISLVLAVLSLVVSWVMSRRVKKQLDYGF